ncbi:VOC family protein [Caldalkalibacillus horti]|uniref:Catechol 2,3-dioxygenase-like lactoylglutathione lyase family enzyme n=1 Tax=Caldalkalibacillus horti TaxID=77523 RepID=A0ABT9W4S6_9BACI|nr:VOC family protein [Bacillus horti]MDQ0167850.1 catechol 2,3-dioxygenase-like lactoylglutathione lyase family enzyme [Bacillus horti]
MKSLFSRINAVYLPVTQLEHSIKWYEDVLGFELEHVWENDRERGAFFKIYRGDAQLGLVQSMVTNNEFKSSKYINASLGTAAFNLYCVDAKYTYEQLKEKGAHLTTFREEEPTHCFVVIDPDDNYLGVVQEVNLAENVYYGIYEEIYPRLREMELFDGVAAKFLPVHDIEAAIDWYTNFFQMGLIDHWKLGADLKLESKSGWLGLVSLEDSEPIRYTNSNDLTPFVGIESPALDEAYQWLKEKGVKVTQISDQAPKHFDLEDLTGNVIRVTEA